MQFNGDAIRDAGKAFLLAYTSAYDAALPQSEPYFMEVQGAGSGAKVLIPEGVGSMWEWKGRDQTRQMVSRLVELDNRDFEVNIEVPKSAYEDDQLGAFALQFRAAGAAARVQPDDLWVGLLTGAFSKKGPDGANFISAAHPSSSGTQSNLQAGALSDSTFNAAFAKLTSAADYYGRPLKLNRLGAQMKLIVGPSLRKTAKEILEAQLGEGGKTNVNAGDAQVEVVAELSGSYAAYWYLAFAGGPIRPFLHMTRKAPTLYVPDLVSEEVMRTKMVVHRVERRGDAAYGMWQAIVGSTGT